MIDTPFRAKLPIYVGFLISLYKYLGLKPNHISFMAAALGVLAAALVANLLFLPAIAVWWLGRLLDGTDGLYARQTNQTSSFGAFIDIVLDMAAYSAMIIGFYYAFPELSHLWIVILFLYVLCITSALSLGNLEDKNKIPGRDDRGLRLAAGIAEGGETGIAYTCFLLFPGQIQIFANVWILILTFTVIARFLLAAKELKS